MPPLSAVDGMAESENVQRYGRKFRSSVVSDDYVLPPFARWLLFAHKA